MCALLDAAELLLNARGPDGFSLREVARAAGVKPATLYDYFSSKEVLVAALADRRWTRAVERVEPVQSAAPEGIAAFVEHAVADVLATTWPDGLAGPGSLAGARDALRARFVTFVAPAEGDREPAVDHELAASIAADAVALLTCVVADARRRGVGDESFARELGRLVAGYLTAPRA